MSLILIQATRMIFGAQNVQVSNPSWMSGGLNVLLNLILPYNRLSVEENPLVGAASRKAPSGIPERIYELFPVLKDMRSRHGGDLSGGQQQQLAIGRALISRNPVTLAA